MYRHTDGSSRFSALRFSALRRVGIAAAVLLAASLAAQHADAQVTASVNWSQPTVVSTPVGSLTVSTNPYSYGLNVYDGFDPAIAGSPGDSSYKSQFAQLGAGMIRYHYGGDVLVSDGAPDYDSRSWVSNAESADYAWDAAKINAALAGSYAYGPKRMISIANWPRYLDDGSGHLPPDQYGAYAAFCARLLQIFKDAGYSGQYYEVTNELDNNGVYGYAAGSNSRTLADVGSLVSQCADAMRAVDPTIKVGGPAFARPDIGQNVSDFFTAAGPNIDFVSYHAYDVYDPGNTATNQQVFDGAAGLGGWTTLMQQAYHDTVPGGRPIEYYHTEYSVNSAGSYAPNDNRATTVIGAVSDALGVISMVNAGATGTMNWNEADYGYFGVLDAGNSWAPRLPGLVYQLFNRDFTGDYVRSTTSDAKAVVVQGAHGGSYDKICLINRAETAQTVTLSLTLQSGAVPAGKANFSVEQVNPAFVNPASVYYPGDVSYSQLQSGYTLPANTVTIIQADETALPTGGSASAGSLLGTYAASPSSVSLDSEGTSDWVHWGLGSTSDSDHAIDRKAGANLISDFTAVGGGAISQVTDAATDTWAGGTPNTDSSGTQTAVKAVRDWGYNAGFQFTAPADTATRTLKVYVGTYDSDGQLTATLSDGSAAAYTATLSGSGYQTATGVYTLTYQSASPGQTLTVTWTDTDNLGGYSFSEAHLQAATLH